LPVVLENILVNQMPSGFVPEGFDCGDSDMNEYILAGDAHTDTAANFSRTYLATHDGEVVGFLTLLTDSIRLGGREKPPGIPYTRAPAIKLGRLAVRSSVQQCGVGRTLIEYSQGFARDIAGEVGCRYLTLDAQPERVGYYERQGFVRNHAELRARKSYRKDVSNVPDIVVLDHVSMRFDLFF
jgi:GNAT superfamily N-acetyltransferase